ncbi:hypothetical protein GCM10025865_15590 [Paraoerskovia sediminicola]|uniref:VanZ-like domain-containing protein n=1 Tax=Paraoerskovia sediminicola TaxID=1138587 RepID=A0ABM8G2G6_9CELL|nr:VanZ family protein [Paraoerskovia sediminicola]BDZ42260.1 hypothetical protein GCM10025865_15590 [Paraoerskovia sediminicola]
MTTGRATRVPEREPDRRRAAPVVLRVVAGVYLAAVLVVTLWPTPQESPAPGWARAVLDAAARVGVPLTYDVLEVVSNVVMFVPFGVLGVLLVRDGRPVRVVALVVVVAAALSTAIETAQTQIPGRVPTVQDVVLNTAGALLGALVAVVLLVLRDRRAT